MDPSAYYQLHTFQTIMGDQSIQVVSKPGLPDWKAISPAEALLGEHFHSSVGDRILVYGCRQGALGVPLARQVAPGEVTLNDLTILSAVCTQETLQRNRIDNAHFNPYPFTTDTQAEGWDAIAILLPKGRKLLRRWLAESHQLLREGGQLYLAGANREGIQPALKDAQAVFGPGSLLGYRKGCRAMRFLKKKPGEAPPNWLNEAGILPDSWHEFTFTRDADIFHFANLPGVFSYEGLDEGTHFLLDHTPEVEGREVLDFGCGCGVIGVLAGYYEAVSVDLIDANLLAVQAAKENIARLGLKQARAFASDGLKAVGGRQYDLILSNPPFHTGKAVNYQVTEAFLQDSGKVLRSGGKLVLVANRFIRYERLMESYFRKVNVLAQDDRYRVIEGVK